jgi:uncharacterized membrane protein YgcG
MVPARHVEELAKQMPNLDVQQGYLIPKDADPNLPLPLRAQNVVPGVTYAAMHVGIEPLSTSSPTGLEKMFSDATSGGGGSSSGSGSGSKSGSKSGSSSSSKSGGTTKK